MAERISITREQLEMMRRRVAPLIDSIGRERPLVDLLAEAYCQGMTDAAEVMAMQALAAGANLPEREGDGSGTQNET